MNLKQMAISGTKWTTASTIVIALVSLIKLSVLTRFLAIEDFGLMALVNVVLGFMSLFMDMGLTSAILHKQNITKNEYSSLYWLNVFFSLTLMLIIMIVSPFIGDFYNEEQLPLLLILMSLSLIISATGRQFKTVKAKNLDFKFIAIVDVITSTLSLILAIILAYLNYGVYAIVYSALLQFSLSNLTYLISGINSNSIQWHFKMLETKPFLKIGMYQVGGQVVNYFNRDIDTLIVGKILGAEVLGGYSLAKQLVFRPTMIINPILSKVAAPTLAKIQHNKNQLKEGYLKILNIVSSLNFVAYVLLAILAYPVVLILYGTDFIHIVSIVQILCIYMYLRSLGNPVGALVTATGRTDLEFYWNILALCVVPLIVYISSFMGVNGIAIGLSLFMLLAFYPFYKLLISKMISCSFKEYTKATIINPLILLRLFKNNI
ncbi:MOP flippase family protein [Tamlana agarivorans]|uniref:MOP flippase family protein n=1 Tax=Pseudotamlana agarivorans TaxID=481183 RepID=A0ACC5U7E9_9FLAO|nr:MOP flippase family protein [Tamlana agarivorans]MBU2950242.1 MOP flippase family protein [Tamlana agarivorans]